MNSQKASTKTKTKTMTLTTTRTKERRCLLFCQHSGYVPLLLQKLHTTKSVTFWDQGNSADRVGDLMLLY